MTPAERVTYLSGELQVLSFNMLDELDSLNLHSPREAVSDLHDRIFGMAADMANLNKSLIHNLTVTGRTKEIEEAVEMESLLNILRNCSVEPSSYKHFIDTMIPLIKMLELWSDRGAVPETG